MQNVVSSSGEKGTSNCSPCDTTLRVAASSSVAHASPENPMQYASYSSE